MKGIETSKLSIPGKIKVFDETSPKEGGGGTAKKGKKQNNFSSAIEKDRQIQESASRQAEGKISFVNKEEDIIESTPFQQNKCKSRL